ncbi:hypothetical protein FRB90_002330 [Tulasnella sp. 427]|nr:hypothetical protein FRB90_002330 [Tulasnella sp. 427]
MLERAGMSMDSDAKKLEARDLAVDEAYQALKRYEVSCRRIEFLTDDQKRSGGYAIVRKARLHQSLYLPTWLASRHYGPPEVVAVKQIKVSAADIKSKIKTASSLLSCYCLRVSLIVGDAQAFTREMLVWSSLDAHPGITRFLGFYATDDFSEAWLVSSWQPNGNVREFIQKNQLEVPEKLSLIYDTIDALEFLHQLDPPICHGDVKSANVVINSSFRAVLCDFGLARIREDSGFERLETSTGFKGSIRWCSPELINGDPRSPHSDVYAWAWLVWEIMTGKLPYEGTSAEYAIIVKIFEGPRPHVDGESRLSDCLQVWELMTRCWESEPGERPTSGMCRTAITILPRCPPTLADQARSPELLENLGDLESWKGNYDEGLAYLEQALSLYERAGNEQGIASVLRKQASVSYRHWYPLRAMSAAFAALEKLGNTVDPLATAETLYLIGSSLGLRSESAKALAFLKEALEIFRAHMNDIGIVQCLERIGEIHRWQMNYADAVLNLDEAIRVARSCGDKLGEARVMLVLGSVAMDRDDHPRALAMISEACDTARRIGWNQGICTALVRQSFIEEQQIHLDESERLARESIALARQYNSRWRLAQGLIRLGYALYYRNQLAEAAEALEEACAIFAEISHVAPEYADAARLLFYVKHAQCNYEDCLRWTDVAIAEYRFLGRKSCLSECFVYKGWCLQALGRFDEAALHYEAALVLESEVGFAAANSRRRILAIVKTSGTWEKARITHKRRSLHIDKASSLLCDVKKLQRRIPHLHTAVLKLARPLGSRSACTEKRRCSRRRRSTTKLHCTLRGPWYSNFHNAVVQNMQMDADPAKTVIKWESRKYTTLRQATSLCALPLPVDVMKLQKGVPQLSSPSLNVRIEVCGAGDQ